MHTCPRSAPVLAVPLTWVSRCECAQQGMVDFASCDVRGNYGGDATDAFYKASINHVVSFC